MKQYKRIEDSDVEYAAAEHIKGRSMKEIALELGVSTSGLWKKLKIWGIEYKNRNVKYHVNKPIDECSEPYKNIYYKGYEKRRSEDLSEFEQKIYELQLKYEKVYGCVVCEMYADVVYDLLEWIKEEQNGHKSKRSCI